MNILLPILLACSEYGYNDKQNIDSGYVAEPEDNPYSEPSSTPSEPDQPPSEPSTVIEPSSTPQPTAEPAEPAFEAPPDDEGFDPEKEIPPLSTPQGNVVTILMTLSDTWIPPQTAEQLIYNSVQFVSSVENPRVLVVRDDNHNGEDMTDPENIQAWLQSRGLSVDFMEEPSGGLTLAELSGYHVVLLSNPGYPPDDVASIESLWNFSTQGYGIIFQGDDMTRINTPLMTELTRLENIDNGTSYFGVNIDNNTGSTYEVTLIEGTVLTTDIESFTFSYGNDIDTTEPTVVGMSVAADCTVSNTNHPSKPVITAFSPQQEALE
jgi:hypothetical protein